LGFNRDHRINVRLDADAYEAFKQYIADNHISIAQGLRILISAALREGKSVQPAVLKASYREGFRAAVTKLRQSVGRAVAEVLEDLERVA